MKRLVTSKKELKKEEEYNNTPVKHSANVIVSRITKFASALDSVKDFYQYIKNVCLNISVPEMYSTDINNKDIENIMNDIYDVFYDHYYFDEENIYDNDDNIVGDYYDDMLDVKFIIEKSYVFKNEFNNVLKKHNLKEI